MQFIPIKSVGMLLLFEYSIISELRLCFFARVLTFIAICIPHFYPSLGPAYNPE